MSIWKTGFTGVTGLSGGRGTGQNLLGCMKRALEEDSQSHFGVESVHKDM
jgi:hypothetical protein